MKAAIYARAATQAAWDGETIEEQITVAMRHAEAKGYDVAEDWIIAELWPSTSLGPELLEIVRAASEGEIQAIAYRRLNDVTDDFWGFLPYAKQLYQAGIMLLPVEDGAA